MKKPSPLFLTAVMWTGESSDNGYFFIKCNMCGQHKDKEFAYNACFGYYERMLKKLDNFIFILCNDCFNKQVEGKCFEELTHIIPLLKIKDNGLKHTAFVLEEEQAYRKKSFKREHFILRRTDKEVDTYLQKVRDWIKYKSKNFTLQEI